VSPESEPELAGAFAVRELLSEQRCDGIVFIDDCYALGGTRQLVRAGVAVPEEVMVATHVNKGYNLPVPGAGRPRATGPPGGSPGR
jgi:DNA-binding LacI/PurR family transcriptional regulator